MTIPIFSCITRPVISDSGVYAVVMLQDGTLLAVDESHATLHSGSVPSGFTGFYVVADSSHLYVLGTVSSPDKYRIHKLLLSDFSAVSYYELPEWSVSSVPVLESGYIYLANGDDATGNIDILKIDTSDMTLSASNEIFSSGKESAILSSNGTVLFLGVGDNEIHKIDISDLEIDSAYSGPSGFELINGAIIPSGDYIYFWLNKYVDPNYDMRLSKVTISNMTLADSYQADEPESTYFIGGGFLVYDGFGYEGNYNPDDPLFKKYDLSDMTIDSSVVRGFGLPTYTRQAQKGGKTIAYEYDVDYNSTYYWLDLPTLTGTLASFSTDFQHVCFL
jgi:hypothetical protein